MSSNGQNQTKAQRREAARAQALELKKKQEAADKRARLITMSVLGVVLVALIAIVAWLFIRENRNNAANAVEDIPLSEVTDVPAAALPDGGIPITAGGVAVGTVNEDVPTIGIYFDYICPYCSVLEEVNQANLEAFIEDGTANVVMYPLGLLDNQSQGTEYSTRAASAAAWVADRAPSHFLDFHETMFANAPKEGTTGLTDEEIADLAKEAGVPADIAEGIASGEARRTFGQWVHSAVSAFVENDALANAEGRFGTPTIAIDGERWDGDWTDPSVLPQAVADATK